MPIIPNAESLGYREYDTAQSVYAPGDPGAGAGSEALGKVLQHQYEVQTRQELAEARVEFQVTKAQQDSGYDNDNEEDTIADRYETGVMEGLGKAAMKITDSALRDEFVLNAQPSIEEGKMRMGALAHKKRGDKQIATLQNATEVIRKGAIAGGDMANAQYSVETMWRSLQEQGHVSSQDAEEQIRKSKYEMALGKLKTMEPREQIEALKAPWAQELSSDVLAGLRRSAEAAMLDDKALLTAYQWTKEGLSMDEANRELLKIKDADEYEKTRHRFQQMMNDDELGLQEKQKLLYTQYYPDVFLNGLKISEIPELETYQMSPAQLTNLQAAENRWAKKGSGDYVPSFSDPTVKAALRGMIARDEIQKAKTYFSENFALLNESDYRYFETQVDETKKNDPVIVGLRTANQTMNNMLEKAGLKEDPAASDKIWGAVQQRYVDHIEDNGKRPDGEVVNDWIKDEFISIKRDDPWYWFDDDVYIHDMPPVERDEFFQAADALRSRFPGISREQIELKYEDMLVKRKERASQ